MNKPTRIFGRLYATKVLSLEEAELVAGGNYTMPNTVGDSFCQECDATTSAGGSDCRTVVDDCSPD